MKKRKNNKITIALAFIILGLLINLYDLYSNYKNHQYEEKSIEQFFIKETKTKKDKQNKKIMKTLKIKEVKLIKYTAVIEIPKINLKQGLVEQNSVLNNVSKNIEILSSSKMPNIKNSNLILASHSGNSNVSFFNNLNLLEKNDNIYIYYNKKQYVYKIINVYEQEKSKELLISRTPKNNILILITCSTTNKNNQLYIISEQIEKNYKKEKQKFSKEDK